MVRRIGTQIAGALMALVLAVCLAPALALAAQSPNYSKAGSINVTFKYDGEAAQVGTVALYRIALVQGSSKSAKYVLDDHLASTSLELDDLSSAATARAAANAVDSVGLAPLGTLKVASDGKASFSGLAAGLYLVELFDPANDFAFSPFLVSIPFKDDDTYVYDVDATPKVAVTQEGVDIPDEPTPLNPGTPDTPEIPDNDTPLNPGTPENPKNPDETVDIPDEDVPTSRLPQTGQLNWPVPVLGIGGLAFLVVGLLLRRSARKSE